MAYPILGTPIPAFFDSSGSPLASGTVTVTDPDTGSAKAVYNPASDADSQSNGVTTAITLNARGEPATELWGRDGEDYTLVIKDSSGSTIQTITDVRLPIGLTNVSKVKTADESLTNTTLADDTHLASWSLAANTYYKITGFFLVTSDGATQDFKFALQVSSALQDSKWMWISNDEDGGTSPEADNGITTTAMTVDIASSKTNAVQVSGFLFTNASSATTVDLQVAQGTDAGTTTFKKGSWLKFEPLVT